MHIPLTADETLAATRLGFGVPATFDALLTALDGVDAETDPVRHAAGRHLAAAVTQRWAGYGVSSLRLRRNTEQPLPSALASAAAERGLSVNGSVQPKPDAWLRSAEILADLLDGDPAGYVAAPRAQARRAPRGEWVVVADARSFTNTIVTNADAAESFAAWLTERSHHDGLTFDTPDGLSLVVRCPNRVRAGRVVEWFAEWTLDVIRALDPRLVAV